MMLPARPARRGTRPSPEPRLASTPVRSLQTSSSLLTHVVYDTRDLLADLPAHRLISMLDHNTHDRLRPARPQKDASFLAEGALSLTNGQPDRLRGRDGLRGPGLLDPYVDERLRKNLHRSGQLGERLAAADHHVQERERRNDAISCGGVPGEDHLPRLLPTQGSPEPVHSLGDVPIPHISHLVGYLHGLHGFEETEVAHEGNHGLAREDSAFLPIAGEDGDDPIPVDDVALLVDREHHVRVT